MGRERMDDADLANGKMVLSIIGRAGMRYSGMVFRECDCGPWLTKDE